MSFFLQGHSAQPLWAHPPPGDPVFPSPITPVMTLFPSKVLHWRRAFHTFLWGRYRCPGVSRAECPVGQAGASPVSRGNPGPCPLPPRLTDLGLRMADPPLCSPHHGIARRVGLRSLTPSRRLCKLSPVYSAPSPAWLPLWGPALALAGPSGSVLWAGLWADHLTHIGTGAQGPQAGVGSGSSWPLGGGAPAVATPPQTLLPLLMVTPGGKPGSHWVRKRGYPSPCHRPL